MVNRLNLSVEGLTQRVAVGKMMDVFRNKYFGSYLLYSGSSVYSDSIIIPELRCGEGKLTVANSRSLLVPLLYVAGSGKIDHATFFFGPSKEEILGMGFRKKKLESEFYLPVVFSFEKEASSRKNDSFRFEVNVDWSNNGENGLYDSHSRRVVSKWHRKLSSELKFLRLH